MWNCVVSASGFIPQAVLYCCVVLLCVFPCGISVWFILCGTAALLCGIVVWYCVVLHGVWYVLLCDIAMQY